jgi:hypothetical protein
MIHMYEIGWSPGHHIGVALLAGHRQRRIARQQMLQRKNQDRHEEQRRDQLQDSLAHLNFNPTTRTSPSASCV